VKNFLLPPLARRRFPIRFARGSEQTESSKCVPIFPLSRTEGRLTNPCESTNLLFASAILYKFMGSRGYSYPDCLCSSRGFAAYQVMTRHMARFLLLKPGFLQCCLPKETSVLPFFRLLSSSTENRHVPPTKHSVLVWGFWYSPSCLQVLSFLRQFFFSFLPPSPAK